MDGNANHFPAKKALDYKIFSPARLQQKRPLPPPELGPRHQFPPGSPAFPLFRNQISFYTALPDYQSRSVVAQTSAEYRPHRCPLPRSERSFGPGSVSGISRHPPGPSARGRSSPPASGRYSGSGGRAGPVRHRPSTPPCLTRSPKTGSWTRWRLSRHRSRSPPPRKTAAQSPTPSRSFSGAGNPAGPAAAPKIPRRHHHPRRCRLCRSAFAG